MPPEKVDPSPDPPPPGSPAEPGEPAGSAPPIAKPSESAPPAMDAPTTDWETRFKYLFADFENFRRRTERERESVRRSGESEVLRGLLPIYEAFEKAREFVRNAPASDPVRQGMELLGQVWDDFLHREGLRPIARIGGRITSEDFDVVAEAFGPAGHPAGTVLEIVQQGYRFKGGLLRPAKVLVARAGPTSPGSPEPSKEPASPAGTSG